MKTITTKTIEYDEVGRVIKEVTTKEEIFEESVYDYVPSPLSGVGSKSTNCHIGSAESMVVGGVKFDKL